MWDTVSWSYTTGNGSLIRKEILRTLKPLDRQGHSERYCYCFTVKNLFGFKWAVEFLTSVYFGTQMPTFRNWCIQHLLVHSSAQEVSPPRLKYAPRGTNAHTVFILCLCWSPSLCMIFSFGGFCWSPIASGLFPPGPQTTVNWRGMLDKRDYCILLIREPFSYISAWYLWASI